MKLLRFGEEGSEKPGLQMEDGTRIDISEFGEDYDEAFFGSDGLLRLQDWMAGHGRGASPIPKGVRIAPPICRPSKIICIGLNFRDHAEETNAIPPAEPIIFFKASSAFCGPNDDLYIPRESKKTDWEVELAVVIGTKASYVSEEEALDHVAGFALHNDYSERAFQLERGGQWVKGKSCDRFAPFGPYLATRDEISDVNNLRMWLKVNGIFRQDGNTSNLIFKVPFLVSYLSQFMTLLPGDVISTGTPAGVGLGMKPPQFLGPGDEIELGIDGLGTQRQVAVARP